MLDLLLAVAPDAFNMLLVLVVGGVGVFAQQYIGVSLSAERSRMLHDALRRAAIYAIDTYTDIDPDDFVATRNERMEKAIGYMRATMPQTVKKLGLDDPEMLRAVIVPHMRSAETAALARPFALAA